jgi:hypothetical protein
MNSNGAISKGVTPYSYGAVNFSMTCAAALDCTRSFASTRLDFQAPKFR